MPTDDKGMESLQDVLKELLSSTAPETSGDPEKGEQSATEQVDASANSGQTEVASASPGGAGASPTLPVYEVEIVPPEAMAPSKAAEPTPRGKRGRNGTSPPKPSVDSEALLEGTVQVLVLPTASLTRIAKFEHALKDRPDVRWMGTWGKAKQGTTVVIQLEAPTTAATLFQGRTTVETAELAKAGKEWIVKVCLPPEGKTAVQTEATLAVAPAPTAPAASETQHPVQQEPAPAPVYLEPARQTTPGQVDLEASPIASLDALNRFEKLLTSLSPGCRVVNVLSLDGVSTVLITLEGVDGAGLAGKLREKIAGVQIEGAQGKLTAKLPEKW